MWLGLGAAGGILAYRKGGQLLDQARAQGLVATAQQVVMSGRGAMLAAQRTLQGTGEVPGRGGSTVRKVR
jgi:hypothetical protein